MGLKLHLNTNRYHSEGEKVGNNKDWKYEKEEIGFVYNKYVLKYLLSFPFSIVIPV
jgi:hypothetical protein